MNFCLGSSGIWKKRIGCSAAAIAAAADVAADAAADAADVAAVAAVLLVSQKDLQFAASYRKVCAQTNFQLCDVHSPVDLVKQLYELLSNIFFAFRNEWYLSFLNQLFQFNYIPIILSSQESL